MARDQCTTRLEVALQGNETADRWPANQEMRRLRGSKSSETFDAQAKGGRLGSEIRRPPPSSAPAASPVTQPHGFPMRTNQTELQTKSKHTRG